MRFTPVIAACVLAVTVSGAALPAADETTPEVATETTTPSTTEKVHSEMLDFPPPPFDFEEFEKRDADAKPYWRGGNGWSFYPYRPYGLPAGKRSADAEAAPEAKAEPYWKGGNGWSFYPYRPYGLPAGKREE
jgi:mating pheromone alpha-factor